MGDGDWRFVSHGKAWSAPAVSSLILRALVNDTALNAPTPVQDVVITVPAYFGDEERRATKLAGEYAGPDRASTSSASRSRPPCRTGSRGWTARPTAPREEVALVYDLGGGTFDVTVVELAERRVAVVSIDGDHELGGADWDEKLAVHLSHAFTKAHPDAEDPLDDSAGSQALILAAENAKRDLTPAAADDRQGGARRPRGRGDGHPGGVREADPQPARPHHGADPAGGRGGPASAACERIDRVLLVGGCSRMPAVAARLAEELGVPTQLADPDLAVAKGAAVYGAEEGDRAAGGRATW